MALFILLAWQALMVASVIVAGFALWRKGLPGIAWGATAILGALLSYGFVSAVVGLYETAWSVSSPGFLGAITIGILGLACFVIGGLGARHIGEPTGAAVDPARSGMFW